MALKIQPAGNANTATEKKPRAMSAIGYPYFDHKASIKVADVVQNIGGGSCGPDFLASKLDYSSTKSGTFLTRIAAARMFGYVTSSGGNIVLTERGRHILHPVMPEDGANAMVEGFLAVPLFARVYEDFKGKTLPQEIGLKNLFANTYGIVSARADQAVRVFLNSAEQCGFFDAGSNRLIKPNTNSKPISSTPETPQTPDDKKTADPTASERRGSGGGDGGGIHSALVGLLRELPPPGTSWTEAEQSDFITAFTGLVKFIFPAKK